MAVGATAGVAGRSRLGAPGVALPKEAGRAYRPEVLVEAGSGRAYRPDALVEVGSRRAYWPEVPLDAGSVAALAARVAAATVAAVMG